MGVLALWGAVGFAAGVAIAHATAELPRSFERLGPEHGLPHGSVSAIVQTRDGFLWLATNEGLARYDGQKFRVFRFSASEVASGASNRMQSLLEDPRERLWVGTASGVYRLERETGRFLALPSPSAAEDHRRSPLALDGEGRLWVGRGAGVERLDEATGELHRFALPGDDDGWVAALARAPGGHLWALVTGVDWGAPRLYRLDPERGVIGEPLHLGQGTRAFLLAFQRSGAAWLNSDPSTLRAPAGWTFPALSGAPVEPLQAFLEDRAGRVWLGTGSGLYLVDPEGAFVRPVPHVRDPQDWQRRFVNAITEDAAGILWVGTLAGAYFHDPHRKPFRHFGHVRGEPGSLPARAVSAIAPTSGAIAWLGTYGGGLVRADLSRGEVLDAYRSDPADPDSLCDDLVWSLLLDARETLWIGTESGLCFLASKSRRFRKLSLPLPLPPGPDVHRVKDLASADGAIWIGTNLGLVRLGGPGEPSRFWGAAAAPDGLSFPEIGALHVETGGAALLIGTTIGGIDRLDLATGRFEHLPLSRRAAVQDRNVAIFDFESSARGGYWVGTGGGLIRWASRGEQSELPSIPVELTGSTVFSVLEDDHGSLWLGTNQGLVRFDPATGEVRPFDLGDGIGSVEFNRHAAARLASGELAFGGMEGITSFAPDRIVATRARPTTTLQRIAVLGDAGERTIEPFGLEILALGPNDRAVTFDWSVPFFSRSDRCASRYRLDGLDTGWLDAGTARSARYTNLEPGNYRFRVVSANADGLWSAAEAALAVRVLPPYWRTAWFRLIVLMVGAAGLASAYRLRLRRLAQLERMRLRIASDLHDELGGDLSGIAVAAGLVARREALSREDRDRLAGVESTAVAVMHGLRDIVWCVDPSRDRLRHLAERLRSVTRGLFADTEVEVELELLSDPAALPMDLRRALYLSAKELLHNAARHAGARRVQVSLARAGGMLRLEVADDGAGFEPAAAADGTGLASVRRRIREAGGQVEVRSARGQGTRAVLTVPFA